MIFAAGVSDIGGSEIMKRISTEANLKDIKTVFYSDSRGAINKHSLLAGKIDASSSEISPYEFLKRTTPDVVLASSNLHQELIPIEFIQSAHAQKIPSVFVQDFWGNHVRGPWVSFPDLVCVQDELGKSLVLKSWSNIPPDRVAITGQPAFDDLVLVDTGVAARDLRERFSLSEDWPIISFSGGTHGMSEAIRITIGALNILKRPVYFFLRHHPSLTAPGASEDFKRIYQEYNSFLSGLFVGQVIESDSSISSDLINAGSDTVISMYSILSVKACYLRKNCVSVFVPQSRQNLEKATGGLLSEFPPVVLGACLSGNNDFQVSRCLDDIFIGNTLNMQKAQREHFVADGKSTGRVLSAILQLLKPRNLLN